MSLAPFALMELATERPRFRFRLTLPLVVLIIGVAYFLWVTLLGIGVIALPGLEPNIKLQDWVQWGIGLMVVLLAVLLVHLYRTRGAQQEQALARAAVPEHAVRDVRDEDELLVTAEDWQGLRVLEYSRPPKSARAAAIYAKVLIPVDAQYAVRVEDLVAEGDG